MFYVLLSLLFSLNSVGAQAFVSSIEKTLPSHGHFLSYLTSADLNQSNDKIKTLVFVVHGSATNPESYYDSIALGTNLLGIGDQTLIIAPHFRVLGDKSIKPGELAWTDEEWLRGDSPENDKKTSSFDLADQLITLSIYRFPNLKNVVITGHSAGGQFTQHYAIGTQLENNFPLVHFRYVILNPGSYVYLNPSRPVPGPHQWFDIPRTRCDYNSYKYGLQNLNSYLARTPVSDLIARYLARDVVYLLGEADTDTGDGLDISCAANFEGPFRFARGLNFKSFLDFYYPKHAHRLFTVPNVGHSERAIYLSPNGLKSVFGIL